MNNFQRNGSISNSHVGKDFEAKAQAFFSAQGIVLKPDIPLGVGIEGRSKVHIFDLGCLDQKVIVECKSHTWTESGNVPSAKITTWNQAMYFFYAAPNGFRKIFFALKDYSKKRRETLVDYYLRLHDHLIPVDVEFWEYDEETHQATRKK